MKTTAAPATSIAPLAVAFNVMSSGLRLTFASLDDASAVREAACADL
jgi:hypothetical protein